MNAIGQSRANQELNNQYLKAAAQGVLEDVKKFLLQGADPEFRYEGKIYPEKSTALHLSCRFGRNSVTQFLAKEHSKLVFAENKNQYTPLCRMMNNSALPSVGAFESLIFAGANLDRVNERGWTYFHIMASQLNQLPLLAKVLDYVSRLRIFLKQYLLAPLCDLIIDYQCGFSQKILELKTHESKHTAFDKAVDSCNLEAQQLLGRALSNFKDH